MGRIKKAASSKHDATLSPTLSDFVKQGTSVPLAELPTHLASFPAKWPFPRGDLYNWITLLNRFDAILDTLITKYGLQSGPQTKPFDCSVLLEDESEKNEVDAEARLRRSGLGPDGDRELLESILEFSRILLEKCGNRSLYNSSERLGHLLNTTSLSVLQSTLRLAFCLAQRYNARHRSSHFHQSLLSSHYNIDLEKVQKLAAPPPSPEAWNKPILPTSPTTSASAKGKDKASLAASNRRGSSARANANDLLVLSIASPSFNGNAQKTSVGAASPESVDEDWKEWGNVQLMLGSNKLGDEGKASTEGINGDQTSNTPSTSTPARRVSNHQASRLNRVSTLEESPHTSNTLQSPKTTDTPRKALDVLEIPYSVISSQPIEQVLETYLPQVPGDLHYELLNRLRFAYALTSNSSSRQSVLAIRLLAIANLANIYPDPMLQQKVLQADSEEPKQYQLVYQLAELLHVGGNGNARTPLFLQTLAISALEALSKHKSRSPEVSSALSINVNHGILLFVTREAVADMAHDDDENDSLEGDEWRDSTFALLRALMSSSARSNESPVSSGLIATYIEALKLRTDKARRIYPRVIEFFESFIHHVKDGLQILSGSHTFDELTSLLDKEVKASFEAVIAGKGMPSEHQAPAIDYKIPYLQQQSIRSILRFFGLVMTHHGAQIDRVLRNLIDSTQLLGALRSVIEKKTDFGAHIWSGAINILSSFLHNEPTSYTIMVEAGLINSFLEAVTTRKLKVTAKPTDGSPVQEDTVISDQTEETRDVTEFSNTDQASESLPPRIMIIRSSETQIAQGIPPVAEAINSVSQAFGAVCLNAAGLELFRSSGALETFFEIFESSEHVLCMNNDPTLLRTLGSTFDELVRHHPALRASIMSSILVMIARVGYLCRSKAWEHGAGPKLWLEGKDGRQVVSGGSRALTSAIGAVDPEPVVAECRSTTLARDDLDLPNGQKLVYGDVIGDSRISDAEVKEQDKHGLRVAEYILPAVSFLTGFFENQALCSSFVEAGGSDLVLDFVTLPSFPYDYQRSDKHNELASAIHMMAETKPHLVLPSIARRALEAVQPLQPFLDIQQGPGFFAPLVSKETATLNAHHDEQIERLKAKGTFFVKHLAAVQILTDILREVYTPPMFPTRPSQQMSPFVQVNLTDMYVELAHKLGRLHAACVWEELNLDKDSPLFRKKPAPFDFREALLELDPELATTLDQEAEGPTPTSTGPGTVTNEEPNGAPRPHELVALSPEPFTPAFKNVQTLRSLLSTLPPVITSFLQHLGQGLIAKRRMDALQRQNASAVADAIAKAMTGELSLDIPTSNSSIQNRLTYWITILGDISQVMSDVSSGSPSQPSCLTTILIAFKKQGCINLMKSIAESFLEALKAGKEKSDPSGEDSSNDVNGASNGIKVVLGFFAQVASSKYVIESPHTQTLQSTDAHRDRSDAFNPQQLLLELRMEVLPLVRSLWGSDFVNDASDDIVVSLIDVLRSALEGEHEQGAYRDPEQIPTVSQSPPKKFSVNLDRLSQLKEKGYGEDLATEALFRCNNNLNNSDEYCKAYKTQPGKPRNPAPSDILESPPESRDSPRRDRSITAGSTLPTRDTADRSTAPSAEPVGNNEDPSLLIDLRPVNANMDVEEPETDEPVPRLDQMLPPLSADQLNEGGDGSVAMVIDNLLRPMSDQVTRSSESNENKVVVPDAEASSSENAPRSPCTVKDMEVQRKEISQDLIDRSLEVLETHHSVTFELAELVNAATKKADSPNEFRKSTAETLVLMLVSMAEEEDIRKKGKTIAAYAHLLALLLQGPEMYNAALETLKDNFATLLKFVKVYPQSQDQGTDEVSPWIAQILLVIEKLLSDDAQPPQIQWNPPSIDSFDQAPPIAELVEPVVPDDEKTHLFEAIMEVLPRIGKDDSLALSVSRVLVILTRKRTIATQLSEKRNLQRLFLMIKQLARVANDRLQSAFMLTLRHIVEDDETIRQIMRSEIVANFENRSQRQTDTTSYVRNMYHLVVRSPEIFIEITNEKLKIPHYESHQRPQNLILKEDRGSEAKPDTHADPDMSNDYGTKIEQAGDAKASESEAGVHDSKTKEVKAPVVEHPDGVIHYILSELLSYKDVDDKDPPASINEQRRSSHAEQAADVEMVNGEASQTPSRSNTPNGSVPTSKKSEKPTFKAEEHPIYIYRCFLLQCLTELLYSYNRTKYEFINFSRKADPQTSTPSKPRATVLNYLLNSLIPLDTVEHDESISYKKKNNTSNWATDVIVALCSNTGEVGTVTSRSRYSSFQEILDNDDEPELSFVRKFVLEHALKAYKDASNSSEPLDQKYARLMCLADLFSKMLNKPSVAEGAVGSQNNSHKILGKMMFEKNFISVLTASVADIDLNFPGSKRVVKYILRPLNQLTDTAVYLSLHSNVTSALGQTEEEDISSASSVSEMEGTREETPDLFRHSTLGMFEPNRQEEYSSESEEEDEDDEMYDDGYDEEMEFEEEMQGMGPNDGEVVSDEDIDNADVEGPIDGLPGDVGGMDIEVVMEGGPDDEPSEGEDEDEDEEDEGEDDDEDDDDDDEDSGMDEDNEIIAGEITGDRENESLADGEDPEWQSEDDADEENDGAANVMQLLQTGLTGQAPGGGGDRDLDTLLQVIGETREGRDDLGGFMTQSGMDAELPDEDEDEDDVDVDDPDENDEDAQYQAFEEMMDDEPSWAWDGEETPPIFRGHHHTHHHHHHHFRGVGVPGPWTLMAPGQLSGRGILPIPAYRSHRSQPQSRGTDDGTNPLLQRGERDLGQTSNRNSGRGTFSEWIHTMGGPHLMRNFPPGQNRMLDAVMEAVNRREPGVEVIQQGGEFHITVNNTIPHLQEMLGSFRPSVPTSRANRDDASQSITFNATITVNRWQEEARILFGNNYIEKTQRVVNSILRLLVPPAIQEEKIRQQREEEERKAEEARLKKEQEERRAKEDADRRKKEEEEEHEAAAKAAAEAEAVAAAQAQAEHAEATDRAETTEGSEPMEDVQPTDGSAEVVEAPAGEAGPSQTEPRVHTTIRGRQVDITGLAIDPEYLEALPEELREEVIMQQFAEQRNQQAAQGEEPSEINTEFLEALPPEIRAELLETEAQNRRRRERDAARRRAAESGAAPRVEEMDTNDFLASMDPSLQRAVLADLPDEVIQTLRPEFASEARRMISRRLNQFSEMPLGREPRVVDRTIRDQSVQKRQKSHVIQMVDKAGVATLLRLMFMPQQGTARVNLYNILHNVCENRQTRAEVISLLLLILQDGSADVGAVERSLAHLSLRAKTPASHKTPQPLKRTLSLQATQGASSEVTPLMVVQHCLGALSSLTGYNSNIAWFFLTEHESSAGVKSRANRKGKGKETRANKFALNALLSLLDRKLIMESSACMEALSNLLNSITQPLTVLLKKDKEKEKTEISGPGATQGPIAEAPSSQNQDTSQDQPTETPSVAAAEGGTDTDMAEAAAIEPSNADSAAPNGETTEVDRTAEEHNESTEDQKSKKQRILEPPIVPEHNLRLVVNILSARECSSKTFREALSTINNLSAIPGAKGIFGKELIRQAEGLSESILADLTDLLPHIQNAQSGTEVQGIALAKFSPASSDQSKLLRVLTALDYLFDESKNKREEDSSETNVLRTLYESSTFGPLWAKLSECLSAIRQTDNMLSVATILLPLIEALMVVCKNTTSKDSVLSRSAREFSVTSPVPESGMEKLFFTFTEEHRKILNELVRQNPKLMSGSFALLVQNPKVLEFDNKRNYFTRSIHQRGREARHPQPPLQLSVRRNEVFLDSFKSLYFKTADEMKYGKLSIRFHGEEGVDAGGVTREWFQVLARGMFNPNYALFIPVASDRTTFHPNRLSGVNQEHLMFFKFIGRIIGKALYEGRVLDCHFSRAVYKRILGKTVSIKDMETLDLDYYKSLLWMLENDITDIITENFSVESEDFGETRIIDLIPNGRNIPVTEENKHEYVQLVVEYRLTGSVHEQLEEFLKGFHDIIDAKLISIFNEQELELLISGLPDIDVDDWKANTEYHNYNASSPQIQWFWRAVRSFDKEERAKLLQFVTGTSKVPLNGFKELEGMNGFSRFNIHRDYGNKDRLPSSHTCFNQLDLPEYENYETLRSRLFTAMTAGSEYFGFA